MTTIIEHEAEREKDHTVPPAVVNAEFKLQLRNKGETETVTVQIPNRGHSLTIDSGWRTVADTALAFIQRFV
jgi:non-heme chloroperoxidase